ncbi:hypothetical protein J6590_101425 [Homalodisca vitripennis]|nr:hypothetical protein J6590_101425 [Homalodisca vitripennis]
MVVSVNSNFLGTVVRDGWVNSRTKLHFPSIHCKQTSGIELMYGEISTMTSCLKAGNSPARANG